jgi:hypothetical protein
MMDHDDVRFSSFTRDLARRHRRPRSYPMPPVKQDVLEQLCGGGNIVPASTTNLASLATLAGITGIEWSDESESQTDDDLELDELDDEPS